MDVCVCVLICEASVIPYKNNIDPVQLVSVDWKPFENQLGESVYLWRRHHYSAHNCDEIWRHCKFTVFSSPETLVFALHQQGFRRFSMQITKLQCIIWGWMRLSVSNFNFIRAKNQWQTFFFDFFIDSLVQLKSSYFFHNLSFFVHFFGFAEMMIQSMMLTCTSIRVVWIQKVLSKAIGVK